MDDIKKLAEEVLERAESATKLGLTIDGAKAMLARAVLEMQGDVAAANEKVRLLREAVEAVEWVGKRCPWCDGGEYSWTIGHKSKAIRAHKDNCLRQRALAATQEQE